MASAIILLPFYIKYLPTESYGAFAICLSFSALIQILTTYSFDSALYIYFHELKNDRVKLSQVVSSSFNFMVLLGLALVVISFVLGNLVFSLFASKSSLSFFPYGFVSVGIGISQALFKVHGNLLQTREKPTPFLWSNLVVFTIIAATTIVGLTLFPNSLVGPLTGRLLAFGLAACWALLRIYREFGFHLSSPWIYTSAGFNAYTFVYQLQQWVINYFDRFIILFFMPTTALASVGIYDFAVKCLVPIELLLNGLNASIFPKVIQLIGKQSEVKTSSPEINRYFYGQISVIMLISTAAVLILPLGMSFFQLKGGYLSALQYIPYLAPLFILRSIRLYFVLPLNTLKRSRQLTQTSFLVSVVKILAMYFLISQFGLMGIMGAAGIAYGIELVLLWLTLKPYYVIKANAFKLLIAPITLMTVSLVGEIITPQSLSDWLHASLFLISVAFLMIAYRNELPLLKTIKLKK